VCAPTWPDDAVPKQIHLDLDVEDLGAAVAAAELLGAVVAQFQPVPEARRIMLDPAGHPFCLTTGVLRRNVDSTAVPSRDSPSERTRSWSSMLRLAHQRRSR
jgi:Glyoxalase-like domain